MKKIVIFILNFFIILIEKYQYRKLDLDEDNQFKKIINTIFTDYMMVETHNGFVTFGEINITQPLQRYSLELCDGKKLECADNHIVFCDNFIEKMVIDLTTDDYVLTKNGKSKVKSIKKLYGKYSMFDLSVDSFDMSYYTNDILSHNTISTAIYILWYILFNDNKGVMIVANKSKTTKEIINKIKSIYKLLPFYLKIGVVNWNENSISLDNGSRIQTEARTTEPAIGFTIDLLYLDEFAKVPDNIVRKYYGEVVPIVSSIENSKIIITSTPDGFNLFWELMMGAEKSKDDDDNNGYSSMRVYWYQVKGRRDTKIIINKTKLRRLLNKGLTKTYLKNYLKDSGYRIYDDSSSLDNIFIRRFKDDREKYLCSKSDISDIRKMLIPCSDGTNVALSEITRITNWEEEQTKLIGGESMFKQEFDLEFLTDDKTLFDSIKFQQIVQNIKHYEHIEIDNFSKKLPIPYTNLKFVHDSPELFEFSKRRDYYIFMGIDLAEGLGIDYTVINIFKVSQKDEEWINDNKESINTVYDFFKLDQIGMWKSNIYKISEVSHLLYMIAFEFFDPEKVRVIVEMNKNLGNHLFDILPYVFDGNNDYGDAIFLRFKHRETDKYPKRGLLVGQDKKYLVKEFQDNVMKDNIMLTNESNIIELKSFAKKETPSGEVTYKSQTGHDDMVMSCVNLASAFNHPYYKDSVDRYIDNGLSEDYKPLIFEYMDRKGDNSGLKAISGIYSKIYKKGVIGSDNQIFFPRLDKKYNLGIKNIENWYKKS